MSNGALKVVGKTCVFCSVASIGFLTLLSLSWVIIYFS